MKKLIPALLLLSLAISCTKADSLPGSQEQERARKGGGTTGGGVDNSIPPVSGVSASVVGPTNVYVKWNAVPNATSYWVYRNGTCIAIMTNTNYADNYVTPGVSYTYAIAAVINSVLGPKSTSVTVTP